MTRNNSSYWYGFEGIGTVRQLMDAQSQVTDTYAFDAWGNELTTPQSPIPNPFKYVGKYGYYLDAQSALMLLGVRYYKAEVGRFVSLDPILWLTNRYYSYHQDNPVNYIDPSGLIGCNQKECKKQSQSFKVIVKHEWPTGRKCYKQIGRGYMIGEEWEIHEHITYVLSICNCVPAAYLFKCIPIEICECKYYYNNLDFKYKECRNWKYVAPPPEPEEEIEKIVEEIVKTIGCAIGCAAICAIVCGPSGENPICHIACHSVCEILCHTTPAW